MEEQQQVNSGGGFRLDTTLAVFILGCYVVLVAGFTALTESLRLGLVIATMFALLIGAVFGAIAAARILQRSDTVDGRNEFAQTVAPFVQMLVEEVRDLRAEARQERESLRAQIGAPTTTVVPTEFRLNAPAAKRRGIEAPASESTSAPVSTPAAAGREMPPQIINVTADLVVEETDRKDEIHWQVRNDKGETVTIRFSSGLIRTFLFTQWPKIRQDNWRRDDHQFGNTARMLQALGPVVPAGKGWDWNPRIPRSEVVKWWNSIRPNEALSEIAEVPNTEVSTPSPG